MTKEQFNSECWLVHSTNISPWPVWQSHQVEIRTKLLTSKEWLSLEPTSSPENKKPYICERIMIMEGGNEDMEIDVTT